MPTARDILRHLECSECDEFPDRDGSIYMLPCTHTNCNRCVDFIANEIYCRKCKEYFEIEFCKSILLDKLIEALHNETDITSKFLNQKVACQCGNGRFVTRFCGSCHLAKCNRCLRRCNGHDIRDVEDECDRQFRIIRQFLKQHIDYIKNLCVKIQRYLLHRSGRQRNVVELISFNHRVAKCERIQNFLEMCTEENKKSVLLLVEITRPGGIIHTMTLLDGYRQYERSLQDAWNMKRKIGLVFVIFLILVVIFRQEFINQTLIMTEHVNNATVQIELDTEILKGKENLIEKEAFFVNSTGFYHFFVFANNIKSPIRLIDIGNYSELFYHEKREELFVLDFHQKLSHVFLIDRKRYPTFKITYNNSFTVFDLKSCYEGSNKTVTLTYEKMFVRCLSENMTNVYSLTNGSLLGSCTEQNDVFMREIYHQFVWKTFNTCYGITTIINSVLFLIFFAQILIWLQLDLIGNADITIMLWLSVFFFCCLEIIRLYMTDFTQSQIIL